jgi:hypothetical protein
MEHLFKIKEKLNCLFIIKHLMYLPRVCNLVRSSSTLSMVIFLEITENASVESGIIIVVREKKMAIDRIVSSLHQKVL